MQYIVIWAAVAIGSGIAAAILAGVKNRDYNYWFALGFLVPPSLLILLLLPRLRGMRPRQRTLDEEDAASGS
jgi:hypothetical protein